MPLPSVTTHFLQLLQQLIVCMGGNLNIYIVCVQCAFGKYSHPFTFPTFCYVTAFFQNKLNSKDLCPDTILSRRSTDNSFRLHGLVSALTCPVNGGILYRQMCAFPNHVLSIQFSTAGLQIVETSQC